MNGRAPFGLHHMEAGASTLLIGSCFPSVGTDTGGVAECPFMVGYEYSYVESVCVCVCVCVCRLEGGEIKKCKY